MRLFLALNPPADLRQRLWEAAAPLREAAPEVAWIPAERLHVTVRFLGQVDDGAAPRIADAVRPAVADFAPVAVTVDRFGAFPTWKRARVVWAGVSWMPALELLHDAVERACTSLGFEVEGRPFRPHLTLARLREPGGEAARRVALAARGVRVGAGWTIDAVDLMRSELRPEGARYTVLDSMALSRRS